MLSRRCLLSADFLRRCTIASTSVNNFTATNDRCLSGPANRVFSNAAASRSNSRPPPPPKTLVKKPPNIKFDPRSKSSPFYGLNPVAAPEPVAAPPVSSEPLNNENQEDLGTSSASASANADYDSDYDQDDDEEEEEWFNMADRINPALIPVIPLPDRLAVSILDKYDATDVGTYSLNPIVFGQDEIRVDLLHRVVQYQRAKKRGKRQALSKTISTVRGSGRKVRPQKGGGTARAGHSRPPHWRGGARAHGPKGNVQDYTQKLNKKIRKLGMIHALSQKLKERNMVVLNDFNLSTHKTKLLGEFLLTHFHVGGRPGGSAILCDHVDEESPDVFRGLPVKMTVAAGNISKVKVLHPQYLGVYDLLKYEKLILTLGAIQYLEKKFKDAAY